MSGRAPATLLFFWDYDTQWGAERSRAPGGPKAWGPLEFPNTERLLELHARHDVPACFAVVGAAALPGARPYHDRDQVRRIAAAGHEVASHAFRHEWLPGLGPRALRDTLRASRDALEQAIGEPVVTFVPPYNQPFDHPPGWSFSLAERREARGERTDLGALCAALAETGYRFCRTAYRPLAQRLAERLLRRDLDRPSRLERIGGVTCVRLNSPGGFDAAALRPIERQLARGGIWVLYGHPHSITTAGSPQSEAALRGALDLVGGWVRAGLAECARPRDLLRRADLAAAAAGANGASAARPRLEAAR